MQVANELLSVSIALLWARHQHLLDAQLDDLRQTLGSRAIRTADSREVMEWMGHQGLATTQRYLQFKPRQDEARRISAAFQEGADVDSAAWSGK